MQNLFEKFLNRFFSNEESVYFAILLLLSFIFILFFGSILLPVIVSIIIAFLLNGLLKTLVGINLSYKLSLSITLLVFFGFYLSLFLALPSIGTQINNLLQNLPIIVETFQTTLSEMNDQLFNYVTGKFLEMIIVTTVSYGLFAVLDLPYAVLIAILVGLSVIIPIFGAILVTIPVVLIGLYEWGLSANFYWLIGMYLIIQMLDGNVLVPILFSNRNNLHPVIIIVAILFFGGLWGFWGLFFAIPLATFIKAIINSWPDPKNTL